MDSIISDLNLSEEMKILKLVNTTLELFANRFNHLIAKYKENLCSIRTQHS